jgi:NADH pyrophosphatase NudC (nudix superfamily)
MKEIRGDQLISIVKLSNPGIKCILSSSNDFNGKEFEHKHIDAVIHTPIDRLGMEKVLNKIGSDNEITKAMGLQELTLKQVQPETELAGNESENAETESNPEQIEHEFDLIRFCQTCGHKLTEKSGEVVKFCAYCGSKL